MLLEEIKEFRRVYYDNKIEVSLQAMKAKGVVKTFDEAFYAKFEGMLYNMTPIDYYIKYMSMGRCYDASAVLGLAFGKREDVFICRGNLKNAGRSIDGTNDFGHGWVEKDGLVYDTTWQIILPQRYYYKLFGVKVYDKRTTKKFFEDCEELSDFNIHDKKYYEENYHPFAYVSLIQMKSLGTLFAENKNNEKLQARGKKLLADLPNIDKVYNLYKKEMSKPIKCEDIMESM